MRAVGQWLVAAQPNRGVYLWATEANAPARVFYERLGASNAETILLADPGAGQAPTAGTHGRVLTH